MSFSFLILMSFFSPSNGDQNQTYELYAVVDHYGDLRNGHYTAKIKDEEGWYIFNDQWVEWVRLIILSTVRTSLRCWKVRTLRSMQFTLMLSLKIKRRKHLKTKGYGGMSVLVKVAPKSLCCAVTYYGAKTNKPPDFIMRLVHFINSIIVSHSRWITLRGKFQFFFVFYLHHTFLFLFLFWDIISHHVSMLKDCIPPCSNHNYRFFFFTDPHRWVKKKRKKKNKNEYNQQICICSVCRKKNTHM